MTSKPFLRLATALCGLGLMLAAPASHALWLNFSQGGFDEGATISGYIVVNDEAPLGSIEAGNPSIFTGLDLSEVTDFMVSFSGNSLVPAFTQTLADLDYLGILLGGTFIGDHAGEGIATNALGSASQFDYYTGSAFGGFGGAVMDHNTGNISYSSDLAEIPEPASLWLLGAGLAGLMARRRRSETV